MYGSRRSRLELPDSDLDLGLVVDRNFTAPWESMMDHIRRLADQLALTGSCAHLQVIPAAMPVVKFLMPTGLAVDVTCVGEHHHGIRASKVICAELEQRPAMRPLVLVLKALLRQHGMGDVLCGGLSSFGLCLLVAAYLAWHGQPASYSAADRDFPPAGVVARAAPLVPPVMPVTASPAPPAPAAAAAAAAAAAPPPAATRAADRPARCPEALGVALAGFLELHSQLDFSTVRISLKRGYVPASAAPGLPPADVWISDPSVIDLNVAHHVYRISQIKAAFAEAHRRLVQGGEDLAQVVRVPDPPLPALVPHHSMSTASAGSSSTSSDPARRYRSGGRDGGAGGAGSGRRYDRQQREDGLGGRDAHRRRRQAPAPEGSISSNASSRAGSSTSISTGSAGRDRSGHGPSRALEATRDGVPTRRPGDGKRGDPVTSGASHFSKPGVRNGKKHGKKRAVGRPVTLGS